MDTVDEVREKLPIEQVVGEVVPSLKRAGGAYKGLCPFHNEKTPSFYVTPSRGIYKCFSCGKHGDIFTFIMETRNMDFRDALHLLADKAGVRIEETPRDGGGESPSRRIYDANAAAATYFQGMLAAPAGAPARAYLERRAITRDTIESFGLGYAPETRDGLCARLRSGGYTDEQIVAAGLATAPEDGGPIRDYFRGRVMFPIRDAKGGILGFGGRVMGDGQPKYLNTRATAVFEKSRVLYAIEAARDSIRGSREGVIVEGYMDALRAHQEGFTNVVATLGTSITGDQLRALARYLPSRLVLALDADPAGQKAAVRAGLNALGELPKKQATTPGERAEQVQVYVATLPPGQDPDDAIRADPTVWRRAIADATRLMDHYFALVEAGLDRARPEWKQEALDTLIPSIGQLDGVGLQQTYIERLSELTGIDARYIREQTPGAAPLALLKGYGGKGRRDAGRRGEADGAPRPGGITAPLAAAHDPVRVTEEYLLGLLLLHRPLTADTRSELSAYVLSTVELAPLLTAVLSGEEPPSEADETVERLIAAAGLQPPLARHQLAGAVRLCVTRAEEERARRRLLELGDVLSQVDVETGREMNDRTLEAFVRKEQQSVRLVREQDGRRRQPYGDPFYDVT